MKNYILNPGLMKEKKQQNKVVGLRIKEETNQTLEKIAVANNISKSEVVDIAVKYLLKS